MSESPAPSAWPALPLEAWQATHDALHRWVQVVGKLRVAGAPWTNHSWHVTLSPTARGLASAPLPCGDRFFQAEFDFLAQQLRFAVSDGTTAAVALHAQSVADFHRRVAEALASLRITMQISRQPCEIADALPFDQDTAPRPYDGAAVQRWWRVLLQADRVLRIFRARFRGKCSPVHFFWGAMDLALTRFSGRAAPEHPGGVPQLADWVVREAYSHEVSSCGFWAGTGLGYPAFYAYAYPEPAGFSEHALQVPGAFYSRDLREFILPYEVVRHAGHPDRLLLAFLQGTYEAAADAAKWDRAGLECSLP
jgi:hypothetical protein